MKDILNNYGIYIYIGLGVIIAIIIILCIFFRKKKEPEESTSSILDISIDGVVDSNFEYGYEKEDTITNLKPVKKEKNKKKK